MTRILLVGCGKMGSSLLAGWLDRGVAPSEVTVVEPGGLPPAVAGRGVRVVPSADVIPAEFVPEVIVLAVKPQVMAQAAAPYARLAASSVVLTIAAGKPLAFFADLFGAGTAVVRAMPNTPAAVRRGITVCIANAHADAAQKAACQTLLEAVGDVAWIEDEALMDVVTAVSGSGPAYVFLLAEVMAAAGVKAGLSADLADRLARATVSGSGELLRQSDDSSAQLRINVTSPGGTTAAALAVLMDAATGFGPLMDKGVAAATQRGRELAG